MVELKGQGHYTANIGQEIHCVDVVSVEEASQWNQQADQDDDQTVGADSGDT